MLACVICVLLGIAIGLYAVRPTYAVDTAIAAKADRSALASIQNAFTSIADELKPAVVYISAERTIETSAMPDINELFRGFPFGDSPFGDIQPRSVPRQATASGSGVIVRSDGYILTNDHVVAGAERVTVKLDNGKEYPGKVTRDQRTDLAVVKIEATGLPTAKLANSDMVKVGQWAIAIGSPFGLTNSVTVGVVSAVTRAASVADPDMPEGARNYPDLIQTDASINPGNSGGPLVNIDGEIMGINTIISSPTGTNAGIGFAVPANTAKYVIDELIEHGKVSWGQLGVEITDVSQAAAKTLGVEKGALVGNVVPDSPAEKAGIKAMDVIVEVNGKQTDDSLAVRRLIERIKPGTKIPLVIVRDGKRLNLDATVGEASSQPTETPEGDKTKIGLSVQELTPDIIGKLGIPPGTGGVMVKSVEAGSPAGRARPPITPGDVILAINRQETQTVAQFNKVISELKSGDTALVLLQRRDGTRISEIAID